MNGKIKIKKRSINSERVFNKINEVVYESLSSLGVRWTSESHRNSFIEVIEDFLADLAEECEICQFKVLCDKRNNKTFSSQAKEFVLEIHFRQPHCLNVSKIEYHINNK
jgi:hypothetical protein